LLLERRKAGEEDDDDDDDFFVSDEIARESTLYGVRRSARQRKVTERFQTMNDADAEEPETAAPADDSSEAEGKTGTLWLKHQPLETHVVYLL